MKVWKVYVHDFDDGTLIRWAATKNEAEQMLAGWIAEYDSLKDSQPNGIEEMPIPSGKSGLLDWLNRHFTTDSDAACLEDW